MRKSSFLAWCACAYAAFVALWLLLRALFFDGIWWLALANTLAEYLFLPLPVLLAAALWRRAWRLLPALALPAITFAALFGQLLLPRASAPRPAGTTITAMTFNVLTSNKDTGALARAIRAAQPDILGLQELTGGKRAALKAALGDELPYHTLDRPETFGNIGLMSRFPVEAVTPLALPTGQPAMHALLRASGQRLHVFVAHLSPNHLFKDPSAGAAAATRRAYAARAAEVARLREEIGRLREPAILLCDCNLTDTSQAYAELRAFLADSFREVGWGLRHTSYAAGLPFPAQRIDYVWHNQGLAAIAAEVGQAGGSDHHPVVVRLTLSAGDRS
jgi:endonuclease/exonuclease/phosphatase (EEP) superfamily protein YafD